MPRIFSATDQYEVDLTILGEIGNPQDESCCQDAWQAGSILCSEGCPGNTCSDGSVQDCSSSGSYNQEDYRFEKKTIYNAVAAVDSMSIIIAVGYTSFNPDGGKMGEVINNNGESFSSIDEYPITRPIFHVYFTQKGSYTQANYILPDYKESAKILAIAPLWIEDEVDLQINYDSSDWTNTLDMAHILTSVDSTSHSIGIVHQRLSGVNSVSFQDDELQYVDLKLENMFMLTYPYEVSGLQRHTLDFRTHPNRGPLCSVLIKPAEESQVQLFIFSVFTELSNTSPQEIRSMFTYTDLDVYSSQYSFTPSFVMWSKGESPDLMFLYIGGYTTRSSGTLSYYPAIMKYDFLSAHEPNRIAKLETYTGSYKMTYTCMAAVGNTFIAARQEEELVYPDSFIDIYVYSDNNLIDDNYRNFQVSHNEKLRPIAMECHEPPSIVRRRLADAAFDQNECQILYEVGVTWKQIILISFSFEYEFSIMEFGNFPSVFPSSSEILTIGGAVFFGSDHSLAYVFSSTYLFSATFDVPEEKFHTNVAYVGTNVDHCDALLGWINFDKGDISITPRSGDINVSDGPLSIYTETVFTGMDDANFGIALVTVASPGICAPEIFYNNQYGLLPNKPLQEPWFECETDDLLLSQVDASIVQTDLPNMEFIFNIGETGKTITYSAPQPAAKHVLTCVDPPVHITIESSDLDSLLPYDVINGAKSCFSFDQADAYQTCLATQFLYSLHTSAESTVENQAGVMTWTWESILPSGNIRQTSSISFKIILSGNLSSQTSNEITLNFDCDVLNNSECSQSNWSGEEVCQSFDYTLEECESHGCCTYSTPSCISAVSDNLCPTSEPTSEEPSEVDQCARELNQASCEEDAKCCYYSSWICHQYYDAALDFIPHCWQPLVEGLNCRQYDGTEYSVCTNTGCCYHDLTGCFQADDNRSPCSPDWIYSVGDNGSDDALIAPYLLSESFNDWYELKIGLNGDQELKFDLSQVTSGLASDEITTKVKAGLDEVTECIANDCRASLLTDSKTLIIRATPEVFSNPAYFIASPIVVSSTSIHQTLRQEMNVQVVITLRSELTNASTIYTFNVNMIYEYTQEITELETGGSDSTDGESSGQSSCEEGSACFTGTKEFYNQYGQLCTKNSAGEEVCSEILEPDVDPEQQSQEIEEIIAQIAETKVESAATVASVDDLVDLEKAASFDFTSWRVQQGQEEHSGRLQEELILEMEDIYSVPKLKKSDRDGQVFLGYSSEIEPPKFDRILENMQNAGLSTEYDLDNQQQGESQQPEEENRNLRKRKDGRKMEENTTNEDEEAPTELTDLKRVEILLKISNSITLELIPGNLMNFELKQYDWKLISFTETSLEIKIVFTNPTVISFDKPDIILITFMNTQIYMKPSRDDRLPIPNGYKIRVPLPVQNPTEKQKDNLKIEEQLASLIITNVLFAFIFNMSMQEMIGMINSLQILAHLPLNNVPIPANAYIMFDVLIKIVSFDFFPLHEHYDLKLTPTDPWSDSFSWLDYDSQNFLENMGSASLIFLALMLLQLVTLVVWCLEVFCGVRMFFRGASKEPATNTDQKPALTSQLDLEEQLHNQLKEEEVKEEIMLRNEQLVAQQKLINSQEQDMSSFKIECDFNSELEQLEGGSEDEEDHPIKKANTQPKQSKQLLNQIEVAQPEQSLNDPSLSIDSFEQSNNTTRQSNSLFKSQKSIRNQTRSTRNCCKIYCHMFMKGTIRRLNEWINPVSCIQFTLTLFIESFFELLICTSVSMRMFRIREFWTPSDKTSVILALIFLLFLILLFILTIYFTFWKAKELAILNLHKHKIQWSDELKQARLDYKSKNYNAKIKRNGLKQAKQKLSRTFTRSVSLIISESEKQDARQAILAEQIEDDFELLQPFFTAPGSQDTLDLTYYPALFFILVMLLRRILLLYIAMFLTDYAWIQMMAFVVIAQINLFYTGYVLPHKLPLQNKIELFNEFAVLCCAYYCMTLIGFSTGPGSSEAMGMMMLWTIRIKLIFNAIIIVWGMLRSCKLHLKRWKNKFVGYTRRQIKKIKAKALRKRLNTTTGSIKTELNQKELQRLAQQHAISSKSTKATASACSTHRAGEDETLIRHQDQASSRSRAYVEKVSRPNEVIFELKGEASSQKNSNTGKNLLIIPDYDGEQELLDPMKLAAQLSAIHQKEDDSQSESQRRPKTSKGNDLLGILGNLNRASIRSPQKKHDQDNQTNVKKRQMMRKLDTIDQLTGELLSIREAQEGEDEKSDSELDELDIQETIKQDSNPPIRALNNIRLNVISEQNEDAERLHQAGRAKDNSERASVSDAARNSDLSLN